MCPPRLGISLCVSPPILLTFTKGGGGERRGRRRRRRTTQKVGGVRLRKEKGKKKETRNEKMEKKKEKRERERQGGGREKRPNEKSVLNHSCRSRTISVAALPSGTAQVCACYIIHAISNFQLPFDSLIFSPIVELFSLTERSSYFANSFHSSFTFPFGVGYFSKPNIRNNSVDWSVFDRHTKCETASESSKNKESSIGVCAASVCTRVCPCVKKCQLAKKLVFEDLLLELTIVVTRGGAQ